MKYQAAPESLEMTPDTRLFKIRSLTHLVLGTSAWSHLTHLTSGCIADMLRCSVARSARGSSEEANNDDSNYQRTGVVFRFYAVAILAAFRNSIRPVRHSRNHGLCQ